MSLIGSFDKAPEEREPYEIDLRAVLEGEKIQNVIWASSAPLDLEVGKSEIDGTSARVWLSGGSAGQFYTVTGYVRTSGGRELARGFGVRVTDDKALPALAGVTALSAVAPLTEADIALRYVKRTAIQTAIIIPALWVGGKTFKVKDLTGWRLVGISLSVSSLVTLGMLMCESLTRKK